MPYKWISCFLCKLADNNFQGEGQLEIGENYNKFAKYKIDVCPLCKGSGRLAIKHYREKPWEKGRKDYL